MIEVANELLFVCIVVGFFGALVANSTGVGGGIIFIPFFSLLGLPVSVAVTTSLFIQSIGMTSGAFSWMRRLETDKTSLFYQVAICSLGSLIGILLTKVFNLTSPEFVGLMFGVTSVVIGWLSYRYRENIFTNNKVVTNWIMIVGCILGGVLTLNISIGIGEIVFIILLLSGWDAYQAIACAVITTSISVLSIAVLGLAPAEPVIPIVLWTGMGAVVGGYLASTLIQKIGAEKSKKFCTFIILTTGSMEIFQWCYSRL